jgi:hypothetical protein
MNAPMSSERLAEIRESVTRAPHPAPGTWAAGLRDLLAEVDRLQAVLAELEAGLAEGRPVDEDPVAFSLTPDGEAALARLEAVLAPPAGYREGQLAEFRHQLLDPAEPPLACDGPEAGGLTVYRASHDSIVMGLYTTATEARAHCVAEERRSWATGEAPLFDWIEDEEDCVAELVTVDGDCEPETVTGYVVTPLIVASEYDPDGDE